MQQAQPRDMPERISWARAIIFATGFFFLSALLVAQIPGYLFLKTTASSLQGLEQGSFTLAVVFLGSFAIIQVIVMLFDPKPVVPPAIFTALGVPLALLGFALAVWAGGTGCAPGNPSCNQFFPTNSTVLAPMLSGKILWFPAGSIDLIMLGVALLGIGVAMVFYSQLAIREQRNPDRRDLGVTPAIRWMIVGGILLLTLFLVFYALFDQGGLAQVITPGRPFFGERLITLIAGIILGTSIFLTLGAFALRLHYLMRPIRKRTMPSLYLVGSIGLAQLGAVFLVIFIVAYPLVTWLHSLPGLGPYLTVCSKSTDIPASCTFSEQAGYLVDAAITMAFFPLLMGAIWAWKSHRNLVIVGSVVTVFVIAAATFLAHTAPDKILVAMTLCAGMLILAVIWTSVARREFAVVGENNLGCLGMWLVLGTCLFIYLAAFALFSLPVWPPETEHNIPFVSGLLIGPVQAAGETPELPHADAITMLVLMGVLAAIQFFFLTRNRYKV